MCIGRRGVGLAGATLRLPAAVVRDYGGLDAPLALTGYLSVTDFRRRDLADIFTFSAESIDLVA